MVSPGIIAPTPEVRLAKGVFIPDPVEFLKGLTGDSMETHIVSWGGNDSDHTVSPSISSTPSIVSVDSVLSHERGASSTAQEATGPAPESLAKRMSSLLAKPSEIMMSTSASTHQRADTADESFTRHHKYFFKDGNVTFLVRGV